MEEEELIHIDYIKIQKVRAHRTYMEAISMYKHMKSGKVQTQESLSNKQVPISINASFDEDLSQNRDQNDVNNDKSKINYTWYDID